MASTHIGFGMACWLAYGRARGLPFPIEPVPLALAAVGSLMPDLDHPSSACGRLVPFVSIPMSMIFGHRGITHSLLMVVGLVVVFYFYGTTWFVPPLIIGYLSHLAGDMLTNSGVPLLWPFQRKFVIPIFNTGGIIEWFVRLAIGTYVVWTLWIYLKPMLPTA